MSRRPRYSAGLTLPPSTALFPVSLHGVGLGLSSARGFSLAFGAALFDSAQEHAACEVDEQFDVAGRLKQWLGHGVFGPGY